MARCYAICDICRQPIPSMAGILHILVNDHGNGEDPNKASHSSYDICTHCKKRVLDKLNNEILVTGSDEDWIRCPYYLTRQRVGYRDYKKSYCTATKCNEECHCNGFKKDCTHYTWSGPFLSEIEEESDE